MNKLILLCLGIFVAVTVNVATAETLVQQKAKQFGLNTASQNQMLTQQLGTELMMKSQKAVVGTYISTTATNSGTVVFKQKGTNTPLKIPACSIIDKVFLSFPTAATSATVGTEMTFNAIDAGDFNSAALDEQIADKGSNSAHPIVTSTTIIPCASTTVGLTGTLSGTIKAGSQLDVLILYAPFNQTP